MSNDEVTQVAPVDEARFFLPASDPRHEHRSIGAPVRMTPTTKPNLAWRCACGWWYFVNPTGRTTVEWHPPADDEAIRRRYLQRLDGVQ
jgi:hypothetical protein